MFTVRWEKSLEILDLTRFERLESLALGWWCVRQASPITVAQSLPFSLIVLTLIHHFSAVAPDGRIDHTSRDEVSSWFAGEHQEWLIELSGILKPKIPSLRVLKMIRKRTEWTIDQNEWIVTRPIEDAWNEVGVITRCTG